MDNFITIPKTLAQEVVNITENNGGIMLMAEGECTCDGNCTGSCSGSCSGTCSGDCSGSCEDCLTICETGSQTVGGIKPLIELPIKGSTRVEKHNNSNLVQNFTFDDFKKNETIIITAEDWNKWLDTMNRFAKNYCFSTKKQRDKEKILEISVATNNVVHVKTNDVIEATKVDPLIKQIKQAQGKEYNDTIKNKLISAEFFDNLLSEYNNLIFYKAFEKCTEGCNDDNPLIGEIPFECVQRLVDKSPICGQKGTHRTGKRS